MRLRVASALGAAVLLSALPAPANGRFPASNEFPFSPNNPDVIWLRTTYGILPSTDNGTTWSYICEDVMGLVSQGGSGYEDPSIGLMANGNVVAADSRGVDLSTDQGCTWTCQGGMLAGQQVVDLDVFPSDMSKAVALVSTIAPNDGSTSNFDTQIFLTTDNGVTWTPLGPPLDPSVSVETIDVPNSDPTRVYVSGTRGFGGDKTASLFMYSMTSNTWTEQAIPAFDPTQELAIFIAGVDPNDADLVYLRTQGQAQGGESRLFVTQNASAADGGAVFVTPTAGSFDTPAALPSEIVGELLGFALSPDGSKVWVGTRETGLWMASTSDFNFTSVNPNVQIQCLATRGSELWACSNSSYSKAGWVAGVSTDDGATFTEKLCSVTAITSVLDCPAVDAGHEGCGSTGNTAEVCPSVLANICTLDSATDNFMCEPCGPDGGPESPPSGGGADAGSHGAAKNASSCGCSAVGNAGGAAGSVVGLIFIGVAVSRRRARSRRAMR
jgi:hypothetical protein